MHHYALPILLLSCAFIWLKNHVPADSTSPVLVHSDVGFHNILTLDGKITALLDWEFTHLGDPSEDIAYGRQFVEPLMTFNTTTLSPDL
jgi:aminoglycoside phosphotransferase (APT) family kinase protein